VSLEEVSSGWRAALDVAEKALRAASFDLSAEEVRDRRRRLAAERARTAYLLRGLASDKGLDDPFLSLMIPRSELKRALGLAPGVEACVFDLEGVLIPSAAVHAAAWAETFDEFIWAHIERTGGRFALAPFDPRTDYPLHIHGKTRLEGVRAFLASRGISLPAGSPADSPDAETVHGFANRKNRALLRRLDEQGVTAYEGTKRYLELVREVGVRCGVVSASANTRMILERAGLLPLIESYVDGNVIVAEDLRPEPEPDMLLASCRQLGVDPQHAAAFETSCTGVEAARACGFALVVGIGQAAQEHALRASGADVVVNGLAELVERDRPAGASAVGRRARRDAGPVTS
jgi:HAD superfamily hydrolase (TIGR01509 family)